MSGLPNKSGAARGDLDRLPANSKKKGEPEKLFSLSDLLITVVHSMLLYYRVAVVDISLFQINRFHVYFFGFFYSFPLYVEFNIL